MKSYKYTNKGRREENQDYVIEGTLPDGTGIYVVADGMGGYSDGAVAASVVANSIFDFFNLYHSNYSPNELLMNALTSANDALMMKKMTLSSKKTGCVVAAMIVSGGFSYMTWLGDTRIYMYREGKEVYRTKDHSLINELAEKNQLTPSLIEKYSSVVTRAIMGESKIENPPIRKIKVEEGDVFVICTDGFYKDIDMQRAYNYDESQKAILDEMSESVSDNYSFIKVEV